VHACAAKLRSQISTTP